MLLNSFISEFNAFASYRAEPMKKKKRIDPSVIAAREAKKIRRIEKEIKRLTKFGRILKPIEEVEIDNRKYRLALYVYNKLFRI